MFEEYFKAHFGHVHKDKDYLEREKLKKQEIAQRYKFDNYDKFCEKVKILNEYVKVKHRMNARERVGIDMSEIWKMVDHPEIVTYQLEKYVGEEYGYKSLKIGKYVDKIRDIEQRIKIFFDFDCNYPESKKLISNFLKDEKNISDFVDALILGKIAEDVMILEVFYSMEFYKACNNNINKPFFDEALTLYNFYNDLSDYIFENTKDVVEKNYIETGNIIKFIEDEERKLRMEIDLKESKTEYENVEIPKQKVLSPNNDKK